ncbi:monosaccharide ABC transporter substrate-binding protein (CUT2 family) [Bacillus oleivorans]|uniref:Monosaccharide ABC transporter substrate-binding protein (CUT2 family) n=1 Tax=Bacillus oleivorans TaxID=1448271 RepID=A0A285CQZ9_9BACI|nr:substrate-binding domain-containing protein [Bacillus oleivorans]SNX69496.1 monosaccharide ABC transporter substrate-binding protein (CUT2 family) [Bacillus oleivorans]
MKKILVLALALMIALLGACSSQSGGSSDDGITIGASLLTASHPFQVAIKEAIEAEAGKQDVKVDIAIADQDLNRQISSIEDFINKQVDAIIVTPVDSDGIKGALIKAKDAGIPVVTVDIKANGVEVDSHIATDNYTGGMIAAEAMAKYMGGEGEVGLITYPEVQSVRDRIDGFKANAANHPGMEIVTELPGRTREEAKSASEDMLTAQPNLKGIFGFGDDMAIAATAAITERGADAVVIGFDGLEEALKSVDEDNAFKAVVVQFPDKMGEVAVQNAVKLANGEEVEKEVPITPGLYVHSEGFVDVTVDNGKVTIPE